MSGTMRRSGPPEIDTMQVCLSGHVITETAEKLPHHRQAYCSRCGAETITACPTCQTKIPGLNWDHSVIGFETPDRPTYCSACGSAFPWQQLAIANAIETLEELGLDQADVEVARAALPDLIAETPKAEVAALRVRRVLKKLGKPAYDVGVKVISDLVSETIKKSLLRP